VSGKPDWTAEGLDWPNRDTSRFVLAAGLRWHVQVMGSGPTLLLLHGAGAATHSWRDLAPLLAADFTVVAPDLPGHGFTDTPTGQGLSLEGMARSVARLMDALNVRPAMAVGHSAGAAIALRLRLDSRIGESGVVSLNGALQPFTGAAGQIFPAMARLLFLNPVASQIFAWRAARPGAVARLLENTGSKIDAAGLDFYGRLFQTTGHIEGALGMMANWDLRTLIGREGGLPKPLTLVVGEADQAVPPSVAQTVAANTPGAVLCRLPGLGHLAHEEAPDRVAAIVREAYARQ
jgi:magnesium chelatase accessory protein